MCFKVKSFLKFFILSTIAVAPHFAFADEQGRLVSVKGNVTINGNPAKIGDTVPPGAKIETDSGASVSILFGQDSVVSLGNRSALQVESIKGNSVVARLEKGEADGVKKMVKKSTDSVVLKTENAEFSLTGGRFGVVAQSSDKAVDSFLVVDGNAKVTYLKDSPGGGPKAGTTLSLPKMGQLQVSSVNSSGVVPKSINQVNESQLQELRPVAGSEQGSEASRAQKLAQAIVDPSMPLGDNGPRSPASVAEKPLPPSALDGSNLSRGTMTPTPLPRDPGQIVPGRPNANVNVTFQP